ncbi:hypothetical protein A8U91_03392 [Halomonas elongata]|uniref:Uncharacterized protein n=1 Tax=Halomonas elongata TaxID=2746 RepID=A0A1B8NWG4_HALEL|nr:hypothetical protein A8U91_03392 [Halomonas elongata]
MSRDDFMTAWNNIIFAVVGKVMTVIRSCSIRVSH